MRSCIRVSLFCVAVVLALMGTLPARPALAQGVTCTVNQASKLRDFPSATANATGDVAKNKKVTAMSRYRGGGADWLRVDAGTAEGWLNAKRVSACDWKKLLTENPQRQARVPGYTPALDQTGPDGKTVFVPKDVATSLDGFNLFRDYLVIKVDPAAYAAENGLTVSSVRFQIEDGQGHEVYKHTENNAPYCLWGDSGGDCDVIWMFSDTNNSWPVEGSDARKASNNPIDPGALYNVTINVNYDTDTNDRWQFKMRLIPRGIPDHEVYYVPPQDYSSGTLNVDDGELRVQMSTLAPFQGFPNFRDSMLFSLALRDGENTGPGVASVVFEIRDEDTGATVYQHRENAGPYCVFGNSSGRPYCDTIWRFGDTGYAWPDSDEEFGIPGGEPLQPDHNYYASATVYDPNGDFGAQWGFSFNIVQ